MSTRPPIPEADLIANIRGIAYAAFMPVEVIMARLRCPQHEAEAFQARAHSDFSALMVRIKQARGARG